MIDTSEEFASPDSRLRWTRRFVVLDARTPRDVAASVVLARDDEFAVLVMYAPTSEPLFYAVRRDELTHLRQLDLRASDASVLTERLSAVGVAEPEGADNRLPPWKLRVVARSADDDATVIAVGEWRRATYGELGTRDSTGIDIRGTDSGTTRGGGEGSDGTLTRYPSLVPSGPATPGSAIYINVDLLPDPDVSTTGGALRIEGLPAGWTSVDVRALLSSPYLTFLGGRTSGVVRVYRSGESEPCALRAIVKDVPDGTTSIRVDAYFLYDDRHCGAASIEVPLSGRPGREEHPRIEVGTNGTFRLEPMGTPPILKVYIRRTGAAGEGRLHWTLDPSGNRSTLGLPPSLSGESTVGSAPESYFRSTFAALGAARGLDGAAGRDVMARSQEAAGMDHVETLRSIGFRLYRDAAPQCFKEVYWALRARFGDRLSIQFITDEPHIPWELMRPAEDDGRIADVLAIEHPVARWNLGWEGYMYARLPVGAIATMAPDYARRPSLRILPAAQTEAAEILSRFGEMALSLPGTVHALKDLLRGGTAARRVAILHFAGHGKFDVANSDQSYIALEDGDVSVSVVNAPEVTLGIRCGTFVIFDACEVGSTGAVLGTIGGWAGAFLARRFSGFVAPLWAVRDEQAATAMTALLRHLVEERMTLGEALRAIRRAYGSQSATYYSYLCFGDVMARVDQATDSPMGQVIES